MKQFDELYQCYYSDVYRFLYKLCGYKQDIAEELTQETFYFTYIGITRFNGKCHIKTWILQIAKNRYLMFLRKSRNITISLNDVVPFIGHESGITIDNLITEKQMIMAALNIVFDFQDNMRYVFLNRIYYDTPYSTISKQLGITETSAKVLFHRAKLLLRKKLKEDYSYEI